MAGTSWIGFFLWVSDAQGEPGGPGNGTLVAWCLMTEPLERNPHLVNPDGHVSDSISLTGGKFNFKNFKPNERGGRLLTA